MSGTEVAADHPADAPAGAFLPFTESRIHLALTLAVFAGIGAVAYADALVITLSLGYLYALPLSLSALIHRLRTTLLLVVGCVALHDWLGPFEHQGSLHIWNNVLTSVGFSTAVLIVNRLIAKQRALAAIVRRQRDELAGEILMAAQVQKRLLPQQVPVTEQYEFAGTMETARTVGGDYYDFIALPRGDWGLAIADVSGKGVAAALLMSSVEMALRTKSPLISPCHQVMADLNQHLFGVTEEDRYVTMFYGRLTASGRAISYCNAGHLAPLLVRRSNGDYEWLETGGGVLGLFPDAEFQLGEAPLEAGDVLVLFTDGVTEAHNSLGQEFSKARLKDFVVQHRRESAAEILDGLRQSVAQFTQTQTLSDDLTLMVMKVKG